MGAAGTLLGPSHRSGADPEKWRVWLSLPAPSEPGPWPAGSFSERLVNQVSVSALHLPDWL